jgi:hypothetical protein
MLCTNTTVFSSNSKIEINNKLPDPISRNSSIAWIVKTDQIQHFT